MTVLHVDSDATFHDRFASLLLADGSAIEIDRVSRLSAARDYVTRQSVHCVVTAADVPNSDAQTAVESLQAIDPDLPVIVIAANGDERLASRVLAAGAGGYVSRAELLANPEPYRRQILDLGARFRTEPERADSVAMLSSVLDTLPFGSFVTDDAGTVLTVNDELESVLALPEPPQTYVGRTDRELLADIPDRSADAAVPFENIDTETHQLSDTVLQFPNQRAVSLTTAPQQLPNGEGVAWIVTDVSEERKQRDLRERIRFVLQRTETVLFEVDLTTGYVTWRENFGALHAIETDEIPTWEAWADTVVHEDDRERFRTFIGDITDGHVDRRRIEYRTDPDVDVPAWLLDDVFVDETADRRSAVGVTRDITVQKEHEEAVRQLHQVAADLTNASDVQSVFEQTIQAAESLLKFDLAGIATVEDGQFHLVATSADLELEEGASFPATEGVAGTALERGEALLVEDMREHPEATPRQPVRSGLTVPIKDTGVFQVAGLEPGVFDARDLELAELLVRHTENAMALLEREAALSRQNERLEEFASLVSHDVRNPLTVAHGRIALHRQECDDEHLQAATDALDRIDALIDDVLTLAREGAASIELESVSIRRLARLTWSGLDTRDATLTVDTDATILADPSRLRQLLENLFVNAVEHGGQTVSVSVQFDDGALIVADDGPGVPASDRTQVFEQGFTTTTEGTGFGLAIVDRIAEIHGWSVSIDTSDKDGTAIVVSDVSSIVEQ